MEQFVWEITKFTLSAIVIPFGIWVVRSHMSTKKELSEMSTKFHAGLSELREDHLLFKADVGANFAPKSDVTRLTEQIDTKLVNMQNAITNRIDAVQTNIANMIANSKK